MEYSVGISPAGAFYYSGIDKQDTACFNHTLYDRNTPIMQFTGMRDVEGEDIWEGDIILFSRGFEEERVIKKLATYIEQEDGAFGFIMRGFNDHFMSLSSDSNITVIGNIYENPELLGQ
jgi:uncharacterized phage protein (TIGR01671 family)